MAIPVPVPIPETLTVSAATKILEVITKHLSKNRTSDQERKDLKKNLIRLVELSSNSSIALNQYANLNRVSAEASVHCTELTKFRKVIPEKAISETDLKNQFERFKERIEAIRDSGVEAIRNYPKDYKDARDDYESVKESAKDAKDTFVSDMKSSCKSLGDTKKALDKLARLGKSKVDDLLEELLKAYKLLETVA